MSSDLMVLHSPVPTVEGAGSSQSLWVLALSQGHTLCTALLSLEVAGGACGSWLQRGTERLRGQCCA